MSKLLFTVLLCSIPLNAFAEYFKCSPEKRTKYEILATQKNPLAQACLGSLYWNGSARLSKDKSKAMEYWKLSANQGHPLGQAYLGSAYLETHRNQQDRDVAYYYLKRSAEQNNSFGQAYLGEFYKRGWVSTFDWTEVDHDAEAYFYFRLSAEQGDPQGQYFLGRLYFNKGFKEAALKLLNLAAKEMSTGEPEYLLAQVHYSAGIRSISLENKFQNFFPEAIKYLSLGAAKEHSKSKDGLVSIAKMYADQGYTDDAIRIYELAQNFGVQDLEPEIARLKAPKESLFSRFWSIFSTQPPQETKNEILSEAELVPLVKIYSDRDTSTTSEDGIEL